MATPRRTPFTMADVARIRTSGRRTIQAIHANQCPVIARLGDCTCENVTYRLVTGRKAVAR